MQNRCNSSIKDGKGFDSMGVNEETLILAAALFLFIAALGAESMDYGNMMDTSIHVEDVVVTDEMG